MVFGVCLLGWALTNMDQALFGYAIPGIMAEFDIGLDGIGWILSISFIFAAICNLIIGVAADRFGRKVLFVFCLSFSAFLVGVHSLAPTIVALTVLRATAFGVSNGLSPLTNTYVVEAAPARYRGLIMGFLQCGYPIGWFIASLIAVPILTLYGWRFIFLPALLVVPLAFFISSKLPESGRYEKSHAETADGLGVLDLTAWTGRLGMLFEPALKRRTLTCAVIYFMHGGSYAGSAFYLPTFFYEHRGYAEAEAAAIVGLSYGVGLIGYVSSAVVGEFFLTRRTTVVIWMTIGAFSFLGLIWLPQESWHDVFWFSAMAIFYYGAVGAMTTLTTEIFPTRVRATAASTCMASGLVGFSVFPVMVAQMVGVVGWQWAFTTIIFPAILAASATIYTLDNIKSGTDVDDIAR